MEVNRIWPSSPVGLTRFWEERCLGAVRVVDLPGDIFNFIAGPRGRSLAEIIATSLGGSEGG